MPTSAAADHIADQGEGKPALPRDLQAVADAWPTLPDALKAGILAMVRAAAD